MHLWSQGCYRLGDQIFDRIWGLGFGHQPNQRRVGYQTSKPDPLQELVLALIPYFEEVTFEHIPREENQLADALATMSSMFKVNWDNEAPRIPIEIFDEPTHYCEIDTDEEKPWFHEVKRYLEAQKYPEGALINNKKFLRRFSSKFFLSNGILYKRNHDSTLIHVWTRRKKRRLWKPHSL